MRMKGLLAGAAVLGLSGCAAAGAIANTHTVTLRDSAGRTVGTALLTPATEGVQVVLSASGLPAGVHGVHIHQTGQCDAPDFTTAGGHFNPASRQHGFENPNGAHAGDLPNITVRSDGTAAADVFAAGVSLSGGPNALLDGDGSALVVHAGVDDYRTDPSGNSGPRIACGVVQR